jgi:hypothetical protein
VSEKSLSLLGRVDSESLFPRQQLQEGPMPTTKVENPRKLARKLARKFRHYVRSVGYGMIRNDKDSFVCFYTWNGSAHTIVVMITPNSEFFRIHGISGDRNVIMQGEGILEFFVLEGEVFDFLRR